MDEPLAVFAVFVGIDVSKDRLDVHLRPSDEAFFISRDGKGRDYSRSPPTAVEPWFASVRSSSARHVK
ncbi:hypothetical protein RB548_11090 [Sinorhizobium chiapasense]|uniref:Transposase n=1 Tax=Sinorhizobium chiapasense TaxID=501572 RepID=A0ABZ2BHE2_9HYPH